jgi:hypothetical protein
MPHCPACRTSVPKDSTRCENCGAPYFEPDLSLFESRLSAEQEAAVTLPSWLSTTIGLVGIAGAAWGLLALSALVFQSGISISKLVIGALFGALYVFSGYSGVLALRRSRGWLHFNVLSWLLQVPILSSPLITYTFASGGLAIAWLQIYPPIHVGINFFLGSTFKFNLLERSDPFTLGVNLAALAITVFLIRIQKQ